MNSITLNDRSETKDQDLDDFLKQDTLFKTDIEKRALNTDADYEKLFTDLIGELKPNSFTDFQEKIAEVFDHRLDARLERWTDKLLLDRVTLKALFSDGG